MAERTAEEIRLDIAADRQRLVTDIDDLKREARTTIPIAVAALAALTIATRTSSLTRAAKLLWKFR